MKDGDPHGEEQLRKAYPDLFRVLDLGSELLSPKNLQELGYTKDQIGKLARLESLMGLPFRISDSIFFGPPTMEWRSGEFFPQDPNYQVDIIRNSDGRGDKMRGFVDYTDDTGQATFLPVLLGVFSPNTPFQNLDYLYNELVYHGGLKSPFRINMKDRGWPTRILQKSQIVETYEGRWINDSKTDCVYRLKIPDDGKLLTDYIAFRRLRDIEDKAGKLAVYGERVRVNASEMQRLFQNGTQGSFRLSRA